MITDDQIRKVLDLTSVPVSYGINSVGRVHREGCDTDLGPEADMIAEARKILETKDESVQTPQESIVEADCSGRILYHLDTLTNHILLLRKYLLREGVVSEQVQTPQKELVEVPVVQTVQDEGKGSPISGEEDSG